jgi:hypothetical protein
MELETATGYKQETEIGIREKTKAQAGNGKREFERLPLALCEAGRVY